MIDPPLTLRLAPQKNGGYQMDGYQTHYSRPNSVLREMCSFIICTLVRDTCALQPRVSLENFETGIRAAKLPGTDSWVRAIEEPRGADN